MLCLFAVLGLAALLSTTQCCGSTSPDAARHPRPDFRRDIWHDLTGTWEIAFDDSDAGLKERWFAGHSYSRAIRVPYPYQAKLSGIGETEHHKVVWYHRRFSVPADFAGKSVRLNIGAADYCASVWVNGQEMGEDEGGYVPFSFDITSALREGENDLTIRIFDDPLDPAQPRGKQHPSGGRNRWHYTHISGIWQPVWLEAVSPTFVGGIKVFPRLAPCGADIAVRVAGEDPGACEVRATVTSSGKRVAQETAPVGGNEARLSLQMPGAELWSPEHPALYDLQVEVLKNGRPVDHVDSYFGVREIRLEKGRILLNGKPIWLNMALVQGYWPDGLYVPPSVDDYRKDVLWCKQLGLNGIRMHQKVEDPRFLCDCDRLGLLVWGEMANAGEGHYSERATAIADRLWERTIERDFNHPCIMTWTYSNEHWMHAGLDAAEAMHYTKAYHRLKTLDPTRPVIDTSGYFHTKTDIWDLHGNGTVEDVVAWTQRAPMPESLGRTLPGTDTHYSGQPIVRSEWVIRDFDKADEAFYKGYEDYVMGMATSGVFCGHCYVQLNDIEGELNGYMDYGRAWKVDPKRIAEIHAKASAAYKP